MLEKLSVKAKESAEPSTYPVGYGLGHTIYNLGREGVAKLYEKWKGTQQSQ